MAGIYIHTPFCKTRCNYCDFYSTTQSELTDAFIDALCKELVMRKDYISNEPLETIYFGGGTPSQLSYEQLRKVFDTIQENFEFSSDMEITLEANPDDLSTSYLEQLQQLPLNRLSIGIQTFQDDTLKKLNRRHDSKQAIQAVKDARKYGFNNISIDLMYGLPGETMETWERDLKQAIELDPEHISAYHLIYEKGTILYNYLKKGYVKEVDEDTSLQFFKKLIENLTNSNYIHYEISNFAKKSKTARHNTSYWLGKPYLGCGPSAHSYNLQTRDYNNVSLVKYIDKINKNELCIESEKLDKNTRFNDYIITGLRTMWGISLKIIKEEFGKDLYEHVLTYSEKHLKSKNLVLTNDHLTLSKQGIFISDGIMSDLLYV